MGDGYSRYADGEAVDDPSVPENRFAHADTIVWETVRRTIDDLRSAGLSTVRILDAGCGPGVWTRRIAEYAHRVGLCVTIIGFDISKAQLDAARKHAASFLSRLQDGAKPNIAFLEHDLGNPLPWADGHFHMVLCNYVVLNHLEEHTLPVAVGQLCRVATDRVIATVRSIGSPPTASIIGMEQVREYRHDPSCGQLALVLKDGSQHRLSFNMYSAAALKTAFAPHADIVDLRAIDLFLSRFAPDENWTASLIGSLPERPAVVQKLKEMEDALCHSPGWVDHGTHILVVARPNSPKERNQPKRPLMCEGGSVVTSFADFLATRSS